MIRDRIALGVSCMNLRERLLRESTLTLQNAIDMGKASESTMAQLQEMVATSNESVDST